MDNIMDFNEDEIDFLQELLNVSFGGSTALISNMLDTFATMHIPKIKMLNIKELKDFINKNFNESQEYVVFSQQFRGGIEGEAVFISNYNSIKHLSVVLNEDDEVQEVEDIIDLSSELLNIVNSATIKDMAKNLDKEVFFAQPSIKSVRSNEIIGNTNLTSYKTIIVVSTVLDFEKEDITGTLYVLLKPKTIEIIKRAAQEFFSEV